jgi:predicted Zn finger-like uncharacterized protein
MDLFTRCPQCETVFRVTTRHLQVSGGQVRCGRCQSVFDAFASLTAKPPGESQRQPAAQQTQPPPPPRETAPAPQEAQPTLEETQPTPHEVQPLPEEAQPASDAEANEAVESVDETAAAEAEVVSIDDDVPEAQLASAEHSEDQLVEDPAANLYEWEFKPAPKLRHSGLWLSLSLLLVVVGVFQAGYIFRTELMVIYPPLKPLYQLVCQRLACEIELPRLRDQLNIEASDLRSVDPRRPNLVQLTALVRNRARVPVEYPAFELTLTNAQQQVVARRVFLPGDYLDEAEQTDVGLAGRRELAVNMYLDTGPLRAAGYRIYLFYPPPD